MILTVTFEPALQDADRDDILRLDQQSYIAPVTHVLGADLC